MSDVQRAVILMSLLPQAFENQVALHPNLEMDPRTLRAYIMNQASRARSRNGTGAIKTIGPSPGGGQAGAGLDLAQEDDPPDDDVEALAVGRAPGGQTRNRNAPPWNR